MRKRELGAIAPLHEDWTEVRFGSMFARYGGAEIARTPVILVHGFVVSSRYMVPAAQRLALLCPVYAVDLPGFGKSCKPERALSFAELADALEEWLAAKKLERVHLLGNSMGCQIMAEYALRHPARVDRMVFEGPTVDRHARAFWPQLGRQFHSSLHERLDLTAVILRDLCSYGMKRSLETLPELLADRIEEKLPWLRMPVLVIRGEKDPICPLRWAAEVASLLPQGELVVVPGGGHALNYSKPSELIRAVRPFLGL